MTAYNGNMIYYDGLTTLGSFKVGNPTTYNNGTAWTFTWEHGRQLATMKTASTTWTNTYNSDGLRTSRTDGTTTYTYYYEEGRLSAIKRNDLNMWIIYDENGPVTLKYGVGTFHYVTNLQGDVVAIVGNQGQKLVEYTYDAWGKVLSITGDYAYNLGIHNPILYRGYIYDHETGFYYCQSRYYDPETGRFLNADAFASTGQGLLGNNMFAYCGNNPVMYEDASGTYAHRSIRETYVDRPGNEVWYRPIDNSPPSKFAQELDALLGDILAARTIHDYVDVYNRIMEYEGPQDIKAANSIRSGWTNIVKGFTMVCAPLPTLVDDVIGVGLIIRGSVSMIVGTGELVDQWGK